MVPLLALQSAPALPRHLDRGLLVLVAALFLVSILAHRHWRARIRLEDQLAAQARDAAWTLGRYRAAWRQLESPAAFVDRVSGLVVDATPGWGAQGLPSAGRPLASGDPDGESAWATLVPPPGEEDGPETALNLGDRPFLARPLGGDSLGLVLVVPRS